MYFSKFPLTYYTLDDRQSVQVISNLLIRVVFDTELKEKFSVYDEYDIIDGETPEILAFKIYGDPNLHWVIMMFNDIIDPRYDWVLSAENLRRYVEDKYTDINGIHHYEDSTRQYVNGNVTINSSSLDGYNVGDAIINETLTGTGYIVSKPTINSAIVKVSTGGFQSGNEIRLAANTSTLTTITSTSVNFGTPVTNWQYESEINESKRKIKIIKPQFVQRIVKDFDSKLAEINV